MDFEKAKCVRFLGLTPGKTEAAQSVTSMLVVTCTEAVLY